MKREYFAYGSILEALSTGLYPDKRHVIREFVQNAFDALVDWRDLSGEHMLGPIEIKIEGQSIFIADKGLGMNKAEAQKYRYLGYSVKDRSQTVGFRGIGKSSGSAVADKIIVTTSRFKDPNQYKIVIDAQRMLEVAASGKNPPLEELLENHTSVAEDSENPDLHYTFVELHNIRPDARILFDSNNLKDYLRCNVPVPFDPNFECRDEVTERLKENVPGFAYTNVVLNGEILYKPFPSEYARPEYVLIFSDDKADAPLLAYCWYCGHKNKGQFSDKDKSGLNFRLKNFAVSDRYLPRRTFWQTTPEREFYFFGEIHVLDEKVIPSSDRTDFEDNDARTKLYLRCLGIAQILNKKAGFESEKRRFQESLEATEELLEKRKTELDKTEIPVQVKPEVQYEIRKSVEDIAGRLKRAESKREKSKEIKRLIKRGRVVLNNARSIIRRTETDSSFFDIRQKVRLNKQAAQLYQVIIDCLKEEFSSDPDRLKRLVNKVNEAIRRLFGSS